jgi:adenine-specific DNA-methyltransferase
MVSSKKRGVFYTPKALAEWMVFYAHRSLENAVNILEPSCGNGIFIDALDNSDILVHQLNVVEIASDAISSIKEPENINDFTAFNIDFLKWHTDNRYGLVIGNPPYIVKKLLDADQADLCRNIHVQHGLLDRKIANIWTAFLLKSSEYLTETGVMAFVLPTEILQVKYAEEIRTYLSATFQRIEIISFKRLAFEDIDQDTVVLFAYKALENRLPGVFVIEVDNIEQLENIVPNFTHLPNSSLNQKWTTGILPEADISLVDELSLRVRKVSDYCNSVAGIVTAASNFFIINRSKSLEVSSNKLLKKIVKKGFFVNNCVDFTDDKFTTLLEADTPCYLIDTNGATHLSDNLKSYIKSGESENLHERFKCKLRARWHDVPGIKKGDGFFFKRSHDYPKCVKNSANVYVTDTAYQIVMNEDFTIESLIFSFYNTLTLLAAEMQGRFYGGGVLELTPNEFKNLPIPYTICDNFNDFSNMFERKMSIEEVLNINDKIILIDGMGLTDSDVSRLQTSYKKMKSRRMRV